MPRRLLPRVAALAAAACALPGPSPGGDADGAAPRTWQQVMQRVDGHFDVVAEELGQSPPGDLAAAAAAAADAAALLRLGYGELRDAEVASFGRLARDAESWLLRIAAEAGQGRGPNAQDLFRGGRARYCQRCHDAAGVHPW